MTPETVTRIARRLNGGGIRGSSAALARALGVPVKTARAWMADPTDEANHRRLSRTARRLIAVVAMLEATGMLTEEFLVAVERFEGLLDGPPRRVAALIEHLEEVEDEDEE